MAPRPVRPPSRISVAAPAKWTTPHHPQSATWNPARQDGQDVIVVSFPLDACIICPARTDCTRSAQRRRQLTLRPRHLHEALRDARAGQQTDPWKQTYRARAGIEGTIHQVTAVTGIRQARYTGLDKVTLEHAFAATAINLIRLNAWRTGTPLQRTRTTHLSKLGLTPRRIDRIGQQSRTASRLFGRHGAACSRAVRISRSCSRAEA